MIALVASIATKGKIFPIASKIPVHLSKPSAELVDRRVSVNSPHGLLSINDETTELNEAERAPK